MSHSSHNKISSYDATVGRNLFHKNAKSDDKIEFYDRNDRYHAQNNDLAYKQNDGEWSAPRRFFTLDLADGQPLEIDALIGSETRSVSVLEEDFSDVWNLEVSIP